MLLFTEGRGENRQGTLGSLLVSSQRSISTPLLAKRLIASWGILSVSMMFSMNSVKRTLPAVTVSVLFRTQRVTEQERSGEAAGAHEDVHTMSKYCPHQPCRIRCGQLLPGGVSHLTVRDVPLDPTSPVAFTETLLTPLEDSSLIIKLLLLYRSLYQAYLVFICLEILVS